MSLNRSCTFPSGVFLFLQQLLQRALGKQRKNQRASGVVLSSQQGIWSQTLQACSQSCLKLTVWPSVAYTTDNLVLLYFSVGQPMSEASEKSFQKSFLTWEVRLHFLKHMAFGCFRPTESQENSSSKSFLKTVSGYLSP